MKNVSELRTEKEDLIKQMRTELNQYHETIYEAAPEYDWDEHEIFDIEYMNLKELYEMIKLEDRTYIRDAEYNMKIKNLFEDITSESYNYDYSHSLLRIETLDERLEYEINNL